jgi:hypothetical protein
LTLEVARSKLRFRFRAAPQRLDDLRVLLVCSDRRLDATPFTDLRRGEIPLSRFAGRGRARLRLEATFQFRTEAADSKPFALPEAAVTGKILRPRPKERWHPGDPGTFMANLSNTAGARVRWDPAHVTWFLDGKPIQERNQICYCPPLAPGTHRIELKHGKRKQLRTLDTVTFDVLAVTPERLAYEKLWTEFQAQQRAIREMPLTYRQASSIGVSAELEREVAHAANHLEVTRSSAKGT